MTAKAEVLVSPAIAHNAVGQLNPLLVSRVAGVVLRYGAVGFLLFFGAFKFTAVEAQGIQPLVANSPLLAWLYRLLSVQAVSNLIGTAEIATAVAMALRSFSPRVSALGSLAAVFTFLTTLSFALTTPGVWVSVPGFVVPVPNEVGGFILKDLLLLGGALWSLGEAWAAVSAANAE